MSTASRVLAFIGIIFGFVSGIFIFVLGVLGFMALFNYVPEFLGNDNRAVFDGMLVIYGLFCVAVGFLSMHHYHYERKDERDGVYEVFVIVVSVLTLNIPSALSGIFSYRVMKRGY